jgi:shikimate kinase
MTIPPAIVLIGFTSTGKSAVGRRLAKHCGMTFCDLDSELMHRYENEHGKRLRCRAIFQEHGEDFFRKLEADTLRSLRGQTGLILATGGGAPMTETNRPLLKDIGVVVYLEAEPAQVMQRMRNKGMPAFLADDPTEENLARVMAERHPVYDDLADISIDTSHSQLDQTVTTIVKRICAL